MAGQITFRHVLAMIAVFFTAVMLMTSKGFLGDMSSQAERWLLVAVVIIGLVSIAIIGYNYNSKYVKHTSVMASETNQDSTASTRDHLEHLLEEFALPIAVVIFGGGSILLRLFYLIADIQCSRYTPEAHLNNSVSKSIRSLHTDHDKEAEIQDSSRMIMNIVILIFFCIKIPFLIKLHALEYTKKKYCLHHVILLIAGADVSVWLYTFCQESHLIDLDSVHFGQVPLSKTKTIGAACAKLSSAIDIFYTHNLESFLVPFTMEFMLASLEVMLHCWRLSRQPYQQLIEEEDEDEREQLLGNDDAADQIRARQNSLGFIEVTAPHNNAPGASAAQGATRPSTQAQNAGNGDAENNERQPLEADERSGSARNDPQPSNEAVVVEIHDVMSEVRQVAVHADDDDDGRSDTERNEQQMRRQASGGATEGQRSLASAASATAISAREEQGPLRAGASETVIAASEGQDSLATEEGATGGVNDRQPLLPDNGQTEAFDGLHLHDLSINWGGPLQDYALVLQDEQEEGGNEKPVSNSNSISIDVALRFMTTWCLELYCFCARVMFNVYTALILGITEISMTWYYLLNFSVMSRPTNANGTMENTTSYMSEDDFDRTVNIPTYTVRIVICAIPALWASVHCAVVLSSSRLNRPGESRLSGNYVVLALAVAGLFVQSGYGAFVSFFKLWKQGSGAFFQVGLLEELVYIPQYFAQALTIYFGQRRRPCQAHRFYPTLQATLSYLAMFNILQWFSDSFLETKFLSLRYDPFPSEEQRSDKKAWSIIIHLVLPLCIYFRYMSSLLLLRVKRLIRESDQPALEQP